MMKEWHEILSPAVAASLKFMSDLQPKKQPECTIVDDPLAVELEWSEDTYTATFWFYENRTYEYLIMHHPEGFQIGPNDLKDEDVSVDAPINEAFIQLLR